ncbi:hypothetical protein TrCOL_g12180 [Triparma columacea]|uniref:Uncharacterized protein n=1 Tax=Triparma columacea TaxID=722753 RepID=A0A9W7G206_9STRA|nr:hypothetical protein TrCOL_g12180 [Triparma columacea]
MSKSKTNPSTPKHVTNVSSGSLDKKVSKSIDSIVVSKGSKTVSSKGKVGGVSGVGDGGGGGGSVIDDLFSKKKETKRKVLEEKSRQDEKLKQQRQSKKLRGDKDDVCGLASGEWVDDGLGGVFNKDGFTGRRDEGGRRVFKAHLFNKKGFGGGKDCPFDCDCCFI